VSIVGSVIEVTCVACTLFVRPFREVAWMDLEIDAEYFLYTRAGVKVRVRLIRVCASGMWLQHVLNPIEAYWYANSLSGVGSVFVGESCL